MNLLIYYNVCQKHFYCVYTDFIPFDREVGFINGHGHILIQILYFVDNKLININSLKDVAYIPFKKESLKVVIINKIIRWLYKLRG